VVGGARGNVSQTPRCLKLELGDMMVQELHEDWHQVGIDHGLDWWGVLNGEELPQTNTCQQLLVQVI
jgi:hypothetical protein